MNFSKVCRTCLSDFNLEPIFQKFGKYSDDLNTVTGIKIEINDGLPQNMCLNCYNFINGSLIFRKQCKAVESQLLEQRRNVKTEEFIKSEEPIECKTFQSEIDNGQIKCEYNDSENTCDEDDKPLKYLVEVSISSEITLKEHVRNDGKNNLEKNDYELPYNAVHNVETKNQRVNCKFCQKNLSIRSIDTHLARSHPGADARKVQCDLCDTFVLKEKLKRHRTMMHGLECFKCGYCKSNYNCKELLLEHVATCTAKKKKRKVNESARKLLECDVCHKTMQKASLRMHKAIKHAGLGPVCEHCGKRLGNNFRLNEHYRAKHGYEKFKCSHCEFQSAGVVAMRNHERRHRGEKPFVCELCGAKFHAAYLLAQHRQSHRTEKLAKCDQCPATFKANNSLHMHKITCHSNTLYKCTMCSRAYSCRHYAVKHLRHVHRYRGPVPQLERVPNDEV